jgi:hypothetical protein
MLGEAGCRRGLLLPTAGYGSWLIAATMLGGEIMRTLVGGLIGLAVLAGAATSASADCKVVGWIDSGQGGRPIFSCTDQRN